MTPYCKVLPKHFFGYANSIFLFNFKQFLRKKFFLKLELFIEPLDKVQKKKKKKFCYLFLLRIIFDTSGYYGSYSLI